jgi:hypothetical protein
MTQEYLIGELSVRLEQLQASVAPSAGPDVARLRQHVETCPGSQLASALTQAITLADGLCWQSLSRGDTAGFARQAAASAQLRQFGVCARLLPDT